MLTLLEKQQFFSEFLARFLVDLKTRGYKVTLGEAYRPSGIAQVYASTGAGIIHSNHIIRLAIDLNVFYDDKFLESKEELLIVGTLWKSYSTDLIECSWGGDFSRTDADHFSFSHNGVR